MAKGGRGRKGLSEWNRWPTITETRLVRFASDFLHVGITWMERRLGQFGDRAEIFRKPLVLIDRQILIAEDQHQEMVESAPNFLEHCAVQRLLEVDA